MFERYTEQARRTLFFARYEASQLGSRSIDTEHLLLGLTRENKGLLSTILARWNIAYLDVREEVERRAGLADPVPTSIEIPFSPKVKLALQFAAEEADRLQHNYIGTEHLLLGVLREESTARAILAARGVRIDEVRSAIVALLNETGQDDEPQYGPVSGALMQIERLVQELGAQVPDRAGADALVARVRLQLDRLRRHLGG
jgi:ATP-dependent Clp protease ATP-binding subunit ClpC